ncbi:hypothetical protein Hanom_Chr14g01319721 [Helianthus anomalus]
MCPLNGPVVLKRFGVAVFPCHSFSLVLVARASGPNFVVDFGVDFSIGPE